MSDTNEIDASRAPLLDHLVELRRRLLISFGTLAVAFCGSLYFVHPILDILVQPLLAAGQTKLVYIQLFEAFFVQIKVAFFAATMISFPIVANQLWRFIAPGLYRNEKRAALPFLWATPVLFTAGASLAYFIAIPMALQFLLSFSGDIGGVQQEAMPAVGNYLDFVMKFLFGFGVAFLIPVLLMLLEAAGILTRAQLVRMPDASGSSRDFNAHATRCRSALCDCRKLCGGRCSDAAGHRIDAVARDSAYGSLRTDTHRHMVHGASARKDRRGC